MRTLTEKTNKVIELDLPKKDKEGKSYLSYSQIQLFKKNKQEYKRRYILNQPFEGNAFTDFGSKIGKALETNNFNGLFKKEQEVLSKCKRLDSFERKVKLNYDGFYVVGYIDTISDSFDRIIDYKTGGKNKEYQYQEDNYDQLCYYALAIRQETGITPTTAQVNFIRREGNPFRGEMLKVSNEAPLLIDVDITIERLKKVYWGTIDIAKTIEKFYKSVKGE